MGLSGNFASLGARLRQARTRAFVGRSAEVGEFNKALESFPASPAVFYLHGAGGMGKSALLRRFADLAGAAGRRVIQIDAGLIDLSPAGFAAEVPEPDDRLVLLVDGFEQAQGLEGWLRDTFLPALPGGAIVALAGRRPPDPHWQADPAWASTLRVIALGDLPERDAAALLSLRGVPDELHPAILAFTKGHPLALNLAAAVTNRQGGGETERWTPGYDLIATLLSGLIGEVPSPAHRRALQACAYLRTTTEERLRVFVADADPAALFDWLREQPFIETGPQGLSPHDLVREILRADLRWRNPSEYRRMHAEIRTYLLGRIEDAPETELASTMRELMFFMSHGHLARYLCPVPPAGEVYEDATRPEDHAAILEMTARTHSPESAEIAAFWLDRRPEAFTVYRDAMTGAPLAYLAWLRVSDPAPDELTTDPTVAAAWDHAAATAPLRPGEHLALSRFAVYASDHRTNPASALLHQRVLTLWLRSERMAWSFLCAYDAAYWTTLHECLQHPAVGQVAAGTGHYTLYAHDWRAVPPRTWLETIDFMALAPAPATEETPRFTVLSREQFDAAVHEALRSWRRPDVLAASPLLGTRMVAQATPDSGSEVNTLRDLLAEAVDDLHTASPKFHRVLAATYFHGASTQEAAAERLNLPFSTYRRHLRRATDLVSENLWRRELNGSAAGGTGPGD